MFVVSSLVDRALRAVGAFLVASTQPEPAWSLSRQERLALIFSAIDRCGTDCPACAIWALEQERFQAAPDAEPTERRLPC